MNVNVLALVATACTALGLGAVAFLRAPDRPSNQLFAVNALLISAWAALTAWIQLADDAATAALYLRVIHVVGVFVAATLVDFAWVFPDSLRPGPLRRRLLLYVAAAVVAVIAGRPALVKAVTLTPAGPSVEFGWPLAVVGIYAVILVGYANAVLWRKARSRYGAPRVQIVYVLVGGALTAGIVFIIDFVIPIFWHTTAYASWGAAACLCYAVAITLAMAKYRLWELTTLGRRAAAAFLAALGLVGIGIGVVYLFQAASPVATLGYVRLTVLAVFIGTVVGMALPAAYSFLLSALGLSVEDRSNRAAMLFHALGEAVVHGSSDAEPLAAILEGTQRFLEASRVQAYLRGEDGVYRRVGMATGGDEQATGAKHVPPDEIPPPVAELLAFDELQGPLSEDELVRFASLEEAERKLLPMRALGATVLVPIRWQEQAIGVLVLGPKLSRDVYDALDMEVLAGVGNYAAIAVKNAELRAEILAQKQRMEKVIAEMDSGLVVADTRGEIRLANPAACVMLGRAEGEIVGAPIDILPADLAGRLRMALRSGVLTSGARLYLDPERRFPVAVSTFALRSGMEGLEGAGLVFRDLRTEEALHRAEKEAERLRFIRTLAAGLAHEIRNPLVAIRTFAELAPLRLDDPEFRQSFLEVARSEIGRLEELVSQFMTLARPAEEIEEQVDMKAVVEEAYKSVAARAEAKGIQVGVSAACEEALVLGNEGRLRQVMVNLLVNAVEATPPDGRVEVRVEVANDPMHEVREAVVTVWNSGSYIPVDERERIFEPFYTGKASGTGLGLALCQTIVDEHGGRIMVHSDREHGTAFVVRLPLKASKGTARVSAS